MTLGEAFTIRFNELLLKKEVSLYKFLKDNCIPRSTIVNIQKGNTKSPTLAILFQVANGFGITPIEFLDSSVFKREDLEFL